MHHKSQSQAWSIFFHLNVFLFFPFLPSAICQWGCKLKENLPPILRLRLLSSNSLLFPQTLWGFEFIQCCLLYQVMVSTSPFVFITGRPCCECSSSAVISAGLLLPSSKWDILWQEMQQEQIHLIFTGFQLPVFPRLCSEPCCSFALRRRQGWGCVGRGRQGGAQEHPASAAYPSPIHGWLHVLPGADRPESLQVCSRVEAPGRQSVFHFVLFCFCLRRREVAMWAGLLACSSLCLL